MQQGGPCGTSLDELFCNFVSIEGTWHHVSYPTMSLQNQACVFFWQIKIVQKLRSAWTNLITFIEDPKS